VEQDRDSKRLIEEYEAREREAGEKILKRLQKKERISPLDFYPELKLEERCPYTQYGFTMRGEPVWVLLPYFANIIVGVDYSLSEQEFKAEYGLGVDQLLQLQKEGKVSLILTLPSPEEKIPDYLLPLYDEGIEKGFPTDLRISLFHEVVGGPAFHKGWNEGVKLFKGKFKSVAKAVREPWKSVTSIERNLEISGAYEYALLKGFGYNKISEHVKALMKIDPVYAYIVVNAYSALLVEPTVFSLDGIHLVDETRAFAFNFITMHDRSSPAPKANVEVFPFEIGRSLVRRAGLVVFDRLEGVLDYYRDFERARRALAELEAAVYEIESGKLLDRVRALEEAWREVESIGAGARRASRAIRVTLGVVGSAIGGALGGLPGFLAGLLGGLVSASADFISEPLGERIARIGRSSHVVFVYDFVKNVGENRGG